MEITEQIQEIVENSQHYFESSRVAVKFESYNEDDGILVLRCIDGRSLKHHPSRIFYDHRQGDEFIFGMDQDEYQETLENDVIEKILVEKLKNNGIQVEETKVIWEKAEEPDDWFNFMEEQATHTEDGTTIHKIG